MTVSIKSLSDGQLANSKGTLYTAPTSKQAIVKSIHLCNTNSSAETVNIYFKASGGTSRYIIKGVSLAASASTEVLPVSDITLEAADIIEGDTTNASKVDYILSGIENS